jgi:hypothetical protein
MEGRGHRDDNGRRRGSPRSSVTEGRLGDIDLHVCPRCGSELVQPVRWVPVDKRRWRVDLDCPECTWSGGGIYPQPVLDRLDEVLDDGIATIAADLERLERANMQEDVNRFLDALFADGILPEDF